MDEPKTLAEHLKKARAERDPEKLKAHALNNIAKIRAAHTLKECTCGTTTEKHKSKCPVYRRLQWQRKKETGQ
jgi:hypothetical protein